MERFSRFDVQKDLILTDPSDYGKIEDYGYVLDYLITSIRSPYADNTSEILVDILYDKKNTPQALSLLSKKINTLSVEWLITSPFNLCLSFPLPDALMDRVYRGGGTQLVASAYLHAKKNQLSTLTVISLSSSSDFYKKIGLTFNKNLTETFIFRLNVETDPLPEALARFIP